MSFHPHRRGANYGYPIPESPKEYVKLKVVVTAINGMESVRIRKAGQGGRGKWVGQEHIQDPDLGTFLRSRDRTEVIEIGIERRRAQRLRWVK